MSTDAPPCSGVSGTVKYMVGLHDGVEHAVDSSAVAHFVRHTGKYEFASAACGTIVGVADRFGEYGRDERAHRKRCPHCGWIVALRFGTTGAELRRYIAADFDAGMTSPAERVSTILRVILDSSGGEDGLSGFEAEGRITRLSTVLAHISSHIPKLLVCEDCADGVDCDHPERTAAGVLSCPGRVVVCGGCTVFSGDWAGEWAGHSLDECTVKYPCSVIAASAKHALALTTTKGR